jgi:hypothetical protein
MKMVTVRIVLLSGDEIMTNRYSPKDFVVKEVKKAVASGVVEILDCIIPSSSISYVEVNESGEDV